MGMTVLEPSLENLKDVGEPLHVDKRLMEDAKVKIDLGH
jgi:hypothetical protein